MSLSKDQQEVEIEFQKFLEDGSKKEMVIAGPAGTGKTYMTKYLQKAAPALMKAAKLISNEKELNIVYTATTNKAANVLQSLTNQETSTIHSFLDLELKIDLKNGRTYLKPRRNGRLKNCLVFIDEGSMINRELHLHIKERLLYKGSNNKVVYIGDQYQLPPVMEAGTPLFQQLPNQVFLTEIKRQAKNSPIITTAHQFREVLDLDRDSLWPAIKDTGKEVRLLSGSEMQKLMDAKYPHAAGPDDLKFLSWTNKRARHADAHIRDVMQLPKEFQVDEYVVVNEAVARGSSVVFRTDQMVRIHSMKRDTSEDGIPGWYTELKALGERHFTFVPESWHWVAELKKGYAKNKDWSNYYLLKNRYTDLRGIYSQTVHKSQGSTYNEVFIDLEDIGKCNKWEEVARMVYVAVSRARHAVYLYGELPVKKWRKDSA